MNLYNKKLNSVQALKEEQRLLKQQIQKNGALNVSLFVDEGIGVTGMLLEFVFAALRSKFTQSWSSDK